MDHLQTNFNTLQVNTPAKVIARFECPCGSKFTRHRMNVPSNADYYQVLKYIKSTCDTCNKKVDHTHVISYKWQPERDKWGMLDD